MAQEGIVSATVTVDVTVMLKEHPERIEWVVDQELKALRRDLIAAIRRRLEIA